MALPENVPDSEPVPGMNVEAVPEAENDDVSEPLAGSKAVPVAKPLKVATSCPVPGSKADPAPDAENEPESAPLP